MSAKNNVQDNVNKICLAAIDYHIRDFEPAIAWHDLSRKIEVQETLNWISLTYFTGKKFEQIALLNKRTDCLYVVYPYFCGKCIAYEKAVAAFEEWLLKRGGSALKFTYRAI